MEGCGIPTFHEEPFYTKRHVVAGIKRNENDLSVWLRQPAPLEGEPSGL